MKAEPDNQEKDTRFNMGEEWPSYYKRQTKIMESNVIPRYGFWVAMDQQ
jgi:hypothetical protein